MNVFQGTFPGRNTCEDGYAGTCPVDAFPANGYGLHEMTGNVWEWCADWFSPDFHTIEKRTNPEGHGAAPTARRAAAPICATSHIAVATGCPPATR